MLSPANLLPAVGLLQRWRAADWVSLRWATAGDPSPAPPPPFLSLWSLPRSRSRHCRSFEAAAAPMAAEAKTPSLAEVRSTSTPLAHHLVWCPHLPIWTSRLRGDGSSERFQMCVSPMALCGIGFCSAPRFLGLLVRIVYLSLLIPKWRLVDLFGQ